MGLNSDEWDFLERRSGPVSARFDRVEEDDFIPIAPMASTSRGMPMPDAVSAVPKPPVLRGAASKRESGGLEEDDFDDLIPNSPMPLTSKGTPMGAGSLGPKSPVSLGAAPKRESGGLQPAEGGRHFRVSESFRMASNPPHNRDSLSGSRPQPSPPQTRISIGTRSSSDDPSPDTQDSPELETISLLEDLTSLYHIPTPATEQLVAIHQALGRASMNITRNKHKLYSILRRSRDIYNYILAAFESPTAADRSEFQPEAMLEAMKQSYKLIKALEEILLEIAKVLPVELETFRPTTLSSWPQSRAALIKVWNDLSGAPFDIISDHGDVLFTDSSHFDDCAWFSSLLHEIIEPEIAKRFREDKEPPSNVISLMEGFVTLENAVKCRSLVESQAIAIDMATMLARTLSGTASLREEEVEPHNSNTPALEDQNDDWLLSALADTFSAPDRDFPLSPLEATDILLKWLSVRHDIAFVQKFAVLL